MSKLCFGCMQTKENSPVCEHCGFDEQTNNLSPQLPIGTLLQGQYLVGRVLGQGGFGITYMGWDQHLSIPVAIKEYYPTGIVQRHTRISTQVQNIKENTLEFYTRHKDRFLKEARTLAHLANIPEIVQIKSFFSANDTAYIVMEYIQGITLKQHLKALGRPMTEKEALDIMEPMLKALQKVHHQGLIHRDISPDNIMIPTDGGIKLIDFGTVRYMDASGRSQASEAVLKPGFAPMEQYNTSGNLGTWTDVYALCATFHYLLTGKIPADVHSRLEEGEELTVLRGKPGISNRLIDVLEQGMRIRTADRLQTVEELYRLLYTEVNTAPPKTSPEKSLPVKRKKRFLLPAIAAAAIAAGILFLPKAEDSADATVPTAPQIQESTVSPSTVPPSTVPRSAEEEQYLAAEALEAAGEYGKAAIAFGKLAGYADARERSFRLWDQIAVRETLSAGSNAAIAIHTSGMFRTNFQIQIEDLSKWRNLIAVSIGGIDNIVGLKADGTVVATGENLYGQGNVSHWTDIVSVSAGLYHTVGLKADGTVVATGENVDYEGNYAGQCDVSDWTDIVAVDAGSRFTVGLRTDGTVVFAGQDYHNLKMAELWTDIIAISAGTEQIAGLRSDGTVVCVGYNHFGECNVSEWTDIVAISANGYKTIGLTSDGTVVFAGRDTDNQRRSVLGWHDIVSVSAGYSFVLGLQADGSVAAAGEVAHLYSDWMDIKLPH
ncbi:MAG: protein kinase [Oscillospiraceae bacterium]|nr:protein kinase [Oscillospiraceae bacterium]